MKLNYKRTLCVGFAFFLICAFWQAYDSTIPLILTNKFGMSQTWSGLIMALDNILALFMLPLFGAISDRCKSRFGRRTPFIVIGTTLAAICFVLLAMVDAHQLTKLDSISKIDDPSALSTIYDMEKDETLMTPGGEAFVLSETFTRDEFTKITAQTVNDAGKTVTSSDYTNYVAPSRTAAASAITKAHPGSLILFIIILLLVLVSMSTFRSPAVALMPDVTMKPLRSKGNAIINLMGSAAGIIILIFGMIFGISAVKNSMMSYLTYYSCISGLMIVSLILFLLTVREKKFVKEMQEDSLKYGIEDEASQEKEQTTGRKLTSGERKSLLFILASIVLWFFGYNAVTSKYSVYATAILHTDFNMTLLVAQAAAIISYLPVGMIASRIGRKKTILIGVALLAITLGLASFMRDTSPMVLMNILFALAGIAWATINVNSFPMVVEMCSGGDVGKYTGYYYTASMAAQVATPILSGFLMDKLGLTVMFPYAFIFSALAFVTMLFVKHGDSKPAAKKGLEALEDMED